MNINNEKKSLRYLRKKYPNESQEGVSIITSTNKPKYIDNIFRNYERCNYPNKELIIIVNTNKIDIKKYRKKATDYKNVRIFKVYESYSLGKCLNIGIRKSKFNYISKMDDDDYYGANYLQDLMNVFKYTDAQITGKTSHFIYLEDIDTFGVWCEKCNDRYIQSIAGATLLVKKEVFENVKFKDLTSGEDVQFLKDCLLAGFKIYSADRYNYIYMKHKDLKDHTWKISSEDFIKFNNFRTLKNVQDFILYSTI